MAEIKFESYERRIDKVLAALKENGISSIEEAKEICDKAGIDPYKTVEETQPIVLKTQNGLMFVVQLLLLKKVAQTQQMQLKQSELVYNHSVFQVL